MISPNLPTPNPATRPLPPTLHAAKWPPEDDDVPAAPGGGGGAPAGGGGDDGNFKRGRIKPLTALLAVLAVGGVIGALVVGFKQDSEKLTVEQAEERKKAIFIQPQAEQLPTWRELSMTDRSDELRMEALKQLAWAKDPAGVDAAIAALKYPTDPMQAMAAVALAEYGSPAADKAKPALLEAFKKAGPGAKPQIAWTLVVLGEPAAFDEVLALYRLGHLAKVQRLGGGNAFDPELLVKLVDLDKLASLAGDESPGVRQLVATMLSRVADAKYTSTLVKLIQDQDEEVARQAAPGLGKIGDQAARDPLLAQLKRADKEGRTRYLEALRDGMGTAGLVLALEGVDVPDETQAWYQRKQIMDMIREHQDPRGGDALYRYIASKPHIHWETEAAFALAEIGDVRAVGSLAKRLRMDPTKIYSDQNDMEMALKRDDQERVVASRMIADLASLYPDKAEQIRVQAEDAVHFWITEMPSPHANGLRALVAMGSTKYLAQLRKWADPGKPLPKEGQQPPMPEEWVIAQSALRYVGRMKDEPSWGVLEKALKARPADTDVTMAGLMQGGKAILGMTIAALGTGASDGMSEWGDPKGFKPLLEYAEDALGNENARDKACEALAWVATKEDMATIAKKVMEYGKPTPQDQFRRKCLLEALVIKPMPGTASALLGMFTADQDMKVRTQLARAIGKQGVEGEVESKLFEMLKDDALATDAALALMLGGSTEVAARAVASLADKPKELLQELGDKWYWTFGFWSTDDLESGRIFRWVDAAVAVSRVEIKQVPQEWARIQLMRQFSNLLYDNGPHSFTRVVLRTRLYQMAQGEDAALREGALRTLEFMGEKGVVQALRDVKGPIAELARQAYQRLMNPKVVTGVNLPAGAKQVGGSEP